MLFCLWLAEVENQTGQRVKTLWFDNGGEYPSIQTVPLPKGDTAPKDHSIHTHVEWSSGTDQPDDPRESGDNAPTLQTEAGILGRSTTDDR